MPLCSSTPPNSTLPPARCPSAWKRRAGGGPFWCSRYHSWAESDWVSRVRTANAVAVRSECIERSPWARGDRRGTGQGDVTAGAVPRLRDSSVHAEAAGVAAEREHLAERQRHLPAVALLDDVVERPGDVDADHAVAHQLLAADAEAAAGAAQRCAEIAAVA